MKGTIRAFSLMSEEDQREGLELIHKLFDKPRPANNNRARTASH